MLSSWFAYLENIFKNVPPPLPLEASRVQRATRVCTYSAMKSLFFKKLVHFFELFAVWNSFLGFFMADVRGASGNFTCTKKEGVKNKRNDGQNRNGNVS